MLLELLSDFQITIPELGRIEARTHPVVLLTSNNTRELTEALKRRCLYLWLDYPSTEHELEIVRLHAPELAETIARKLVEVIHQVRELDLKKPPSIAESIDWARALLLLGADDIDQDVFRDTMSIIVKHRTDLDTVAERVGVRLGTRRVSVRRAASSSSARRCAPRGWRSGRPSSTTRSPRSSRCRGRGRATSARRWRRRWPSRPRTGASSTSCSSASSSAPPRPQALRHEVREGDRRGRRRSPAASGSSSTTCASSSLQAIREGDDAAMRDLARLAIAAFGRRGEGSGVLGVDVQRIRRALGLRSEPGGPVQEDRSRAAAAPHARADPALRGAPAARARARADRAHAGAAAVAAAERARPRAADRAAAGPRRRPPRRRPAQAPAGDPGPRGARPQAPRARRRAAHDARLAADRRRAGGAQVPPAAPAPARALRAVRRLDVGHQRLGVLPQRAARAARRVPQDALVRVRRADLRGHRRLRARALVPAPPRRRSPRTPAWPTSPATPTTAACGASSSSSVEDDLHPRATVIVLGDARTNGRDPRADVVRPHRRPRRPHVLAEPRAAAVLELRRLGDRHLRALLRGLRVLDDAPARGLRQGAHAAPVRLAAGRSSAGAERPLSFFSPA